MASEQIRNAIGRYKAKGIPVVVSMANLDDLQVELDINQNDFAKLAPRQRSTIRTDAYRDRTYQGFIEEIAPEANRQKATVQVKVKVENPDGDLRPDMNASVEFIADTPRSNAAKEPAKPAVFVPATAVRDGAVFVFLNGQAVRRVVKTGATTAQGVRIEEGLIGGEEVILNPPAELKDGGKVKIK